VEWAKYIINSVPYIYIEYRMVMCLDISPTVENDFRRAIGIHLGNRRGNLKRATEKAIRLWIEAAATTSNTTSEQTN
jgi:hypothetical protein